MAIDEPVLSTGSGIISGMPIWSTTSTSPPPFSVPTVSAPRSPVRSLSLYASREDPESKFSASQVSENMEILKDVAKWVGARVYDNSGLRVPTLEGVEVAFIGDWIVRDTDGIVYIYTDEDFKRDFRPLTARDL